MDCFSCNGNPSSYESSSKILSNHGKEKKKKRNGKTSKAVVKLSTDPQSVAARERRHRISDRFKILQSLVPGGTKMDTVSMLEEAINYVKFLKAQIWLHQTIMINSIEGDPFLFLIPPTHHQQQLLLCSPENSAAAREVQSAPPLGLPDSYSRGEEETMFFDGSMNY